MSDITPYRLMIRCLLEHKGDQWQAFTLEFGLAAQGDSQAEVRHKLESMIVSYLNDALTGVDRAHAEELLFRKATWRVYRLYYLTWLANRLRRSAAAIIYREPLPLSTRAATC